MLADDEMQSAIGFYQSIVADYDKASSDLRPCSTRWYVHRRAQVLDDLLGEPLRGRREIEMPSRENAGPKFSAGQSSPRLQRAGMRDIVGAAKRADRTANAVLRIGRIPVHQRKIGSQGRQQSCDQFRPLHDRCGRAAKTLQNGKQFVV